MGFERGKRFGRFWNDAKILDERLRKHNFASNGKKERDFEISLGSAFDTMAEDGKFNCQVISQHSKKTTVKGVYCFGKKHRPDITFDENGIALELKFVRGSGLKDAIGQGYLYRLRYRFVFIVLVISPDKKRFYEELCAGKEKDLEDTLQNLADNMNIFTYIVPAFRVKKGQSMKTCHAFFEPLNQ